METSKDVGIVYVYIHYKGVGLLSIFSLCDCGGYCVYFDREGLCVCRRCIFLVWRTLLLGVFEIAKGTDWRGLLNWGV